MLRKFCISYVSSLIYFFHIRRLFYHCLFLISISLISREAVHLDCGTSWKSGLSCSKLTVPLVNVLLNVGH